MKRIPVRTNMLPDREYTVRHKKDGSPINDGIKAKKRLENELESKFTRKQLQDRKNEDRNLKNRIMMEKRKMTVQEVPSDPGTSNVEDALEGRR